MRRALIVFVLGIAAINAAAQEPTSAETANLPAWSAEAFQQPEFTKDYALSTRLNPFLLTADFNQLPLFFSAINL